MTDRLSLTLQFESAPESMTDGLSLGRQIKSELESMHKTAAACLEKQAAVLALASGEMRTVDFMHGKDGNQELGLCAQDRFQDQKHVGVCDR